MAADQHVWRLCTSKSACKRGASPKDVMHHYKGDLTRGCDCEYVHRTCQRSFAQSYDRQNRMEAEGVMSQSNSLVASPFSLVL